MYVAALKERLGAGVDIYGMSQDKLLALHDKLRFIETAAAIGLPVPETCHLDDPRAGSLAETGDYVLKPINACAGKGVRIERQGTALPDAPAETPMVIQRHVDGWAASSFSMAHEGRVILTVVYRGTIMTGTVAIGFERIAQRTGIEEWIETFVARIGYSGFIAFDFIVDRSGMPFAIECNPRVTSGIHFIATDNLAPMMLYPNRATPPRLRVDRHFQQFWPCLTETQARILRWPEFWQHLKSLFRSKDVTWRRSDPLPFLLMPFTSLKMLWTAMTTEKTLGEAATDDIEWSPEAVRPIQEGKPGITTVAAAPDT
jgi:predicted ATP-grasp superfamily ATP-dependent carboligase